MGRSEDFSIIIVDDEEGILHTMTRIFKAKGYQVTAASSGKECIDFFEKKEFDLAVLDVNLPDYDGTELLQDLLRKKPDLEVIMITGYASIESIVHALNLGASAYITKPLNMDNVLRTVSSSLEKIKRQQEQFEIERMVQENEERLRVLINSIPNGIIIYENEEVVYLNDHVKQIFGYDREELQSRSLVDFAADKEKERIRKIDEKYKITGTLEDSIEFWTENKDRSSYYIRLKQITHTRSDSIIIRYLIITNLTQEKFREERLLASENKFREFFENNPAYCFMISPSGMILDINSSALKVLGYKKEEVVGKEISTIYAPELHDSMRSVFEEWKSNGKISGKILTIITKEGERRIVQLNAESIVDENGELQYSISVQNDITEKIEAEKRASEREIRFESIVRAAPVGIGIIRDRIIEYVSENFLEMIGYSETEIIGKSSRMLYPSEKEFLRVGEIKYPLIQKHGKGSIETVFVRKNGTQIDVIISSTNLNPQNPQDGTIFTVLDITERRNVERALAQSEADYRSLVNSMTDLVFVLDENNKYLQYFSTSAHLLYNESEDFLGKEISKVLPSEVANDFLETISMVRKTRKSATIDYSLHIRKCTYWFSTQISLHKDGKKIIAVVRDITDRVEKEQAAEEERVLVQRILDISGAILLELDIHGNIILINKKGLEIFGYTLNEMVGKNWFDLCIPESIRSEIKEYQKKFVKGEIEGTEFYENAIVTKDGRELVILWHNTTMRDSDGAIIGSLSSGLDISDRITSQKEIRRNEALFRNLAEGATMGIVLFQNKSNPILYSNSFMAKLLQISVEDLNKFTLDDLFDRIHPNDQKMIEENLRKRFSGEDGPTHYEFTIIDIHGNEISVEMSVSPIEWEGDKTLILFYRDISDRKKFERDIEFRENRLKQITEISPDYIVTLDRDLKITFINKASPGLVKEEILNKSILELVIPKEQSYVKSQLMQVIEVGESVIYETTFPTPEDGTIFYETRAVPLIEDDSIVGIIFNSVDITARKQSEILLRESEASTSRLLDSIPAYAFLLDANGRHLRVNKALSDLLQIPQEEWVGKRASEIDYKGAEVFEEENQQVINTGKPILDLLDKISGPDGDRWFLGNKIPLFDSNGKVTGLVGISFDITEKHETESNLKRITSMYQTLISNIPGAVYICAYDEHWTMNFISDFIEQMSGYPSEDFINNNVRPFSSIIHTEDQSLMNEAVEIAFREKLPFEIEYRIITATQEEKWVSERGVCIFDDDGNFKHLEGVILDATLIKRKEGIIVSELEEKEILLREIHHRIKNNLQIISSFFYLQSRNVTDPNVLQSLREGQSRIRMMSLIHEILYKSKALSSITMNNYLSELTEVLFDTYGISQNKIKSILDIDHIELGIEPAIACGIIVNELITNSFKYAFPDERNGEIHVILKQGDLDEFQLTVSDNGIGLSDDFVLSELKSLGLRMVKNVAENQLRGSLKKNVTEGTSFTITFQNQGRKDK